MSSGAVVEQGAWDLVSAVRVDSTPSVVLRSVQSKALWQHYRGPVQPMLDSCALFQSDARSGVPKLSTMSDSEALVVTPLLRMKNYWHAPEEP